MKRIKDTLAVALVGGAAFWLPDIAVCAVAGHELPLRASLLLCIPLITSVLAAYFVMSRWLRADGKVRGLGVSIMLGIWSLGPIGMFGAGIASGVTYDWSHDWLAIMTYGLLSTVLFPIFTLLGAMQDGTIFAVIGITMILLVFEIGGIRLPGIVFRARRH